MFVYLDVLILCICKLAFDTANLTTSEVEYILIVLQEK